MSRHSKNMLLWAMIPVALAVFIWVVTQKTTVYYLTVKEAMAQAPKRPIRISGDVVPGSVHYDAKNFLLTFKIEDEKTCDQMDVVYKGVAPDTFKDGMQIVATGQYEPESRTLNSSDLLVKCPSKYQPASGQNGGPANLPPHASGCAARGNRAAPS